MTLELSDKQRETIRVGMQESPEIVAQFFWEIQERILSPELIAMVDKMLLGGFTPEWILIKQGQFGIPDELHEPMILALYYRLAQLEARRVAIMQSTVNN